MKAMGWEGLKRIVVVTSPLHSPPGHPGASAVPLHTLRARGRQSVRPLPITLIPISELHSHFFHYSLDFT
jgi:hypothetical protein